MKKQKKLKNKKTTLKKVSAAKASATKKSVSETINTIPKKEFMRLYKKLKKERDRLLARLNLSSEEIDSAELPDWIDLASASQERELSIILKGNVGDELAKIERALEMMEKGTYGICEECKKPISKERLYALPFARYCITCEEKKESGL